MLASKIIKDKKSREHRYLILATREGAGESVLKMSNPGANMFIENGLSPK